MENLFVLHVSQLEKMIKLWFFFNRCAIESSTKAVWTNSYWKTKKFSKPFLLCTIWWEVVLSCRFFILSTAKIINTSQYGFVVTIFVELFTAHLLKTKSRCYHLLKPRYMQNKKVFQTVLLPWDIVLSYRLFILSMEKRSEQVNRDLFTRFLWGFSRRIF